MQNRYAGDIGDFGKYGLLRSLARGTELSPGVCSYLHPDEDQRNDGSHTQYLQQTRDNRIRFRALDPEFYDRLAREGPRGQPQHRLGPGRGHPAGGHPVLRGDPGNTPRHAGPGESQGQGNRESGLAPPGRGSTGPGLVAFPDIFVKI